MHYLFDKRRATICSNCLPQQQQHQSKKKEIDSMWDRHDLKQKKRLPTQSNATECHCRPYSTIITLFNSIIYLYICTQVYVLCVHVEFRIGMRKIIKQHRQHATCSREIDGRSLFRMLCLYSIMVEIRVSHTVFYIQRYNNNYYHVNHNIFIGARCSL